MLFYFITDCSPLLTISLQNRPQKHRNTMKADNRVQKWQRLLSFNRSCKISLLYYYRLCQTDFELKWKTLNIKFTYANRLIRLSKKAIVFIFLPPFLKLRWWNTITKTWWFINMCARISLICLNHLNLKNLYYTFGIIIVLKLNWIAMYSDDYSSIVRVFELGHTETSSYKGRVRSNAEG